MLGESTMESLSKLFRICAYEAPYVQVGDSVNYAFIEEGTTLYIFFQGSNSITDWVRNFWFFKKPYKDMEIPYKVHSGFLAAWKTVEDIIINKITELNSSDTVRTWYNDTDFIDRPDYKWKKIITVGYSHGGALSGFCHECVWFYRPDIRNNIFGYGFESPRFYHGFWVKKALKERWKNYIIIRNHNDIVTRVPPKILCFTHVGTVLHLRSSKVNKYKFPKCVASHYPENIYETLLELDVD